jgi:2-amino-4-hydroxy-6-hydroxymethyldihydropteridine diphosphokinase
MENGIFLGLGSNLGDRLATMTKAVDLLVQQGAVLKNTSDVYETPPWGNVDQPAFFNRVIEIGFLGEPEELLSILLSTENQLGRVRTVHWGPRVIDIDLLAFGSEVILGQRLTVPHPLLRDRAFVLVPWAEIAPDFIVPNINQTVQELLEQLPAPERAAIQRLPRS